MSETCESIGEMELEVSGLQPPPQAGLSRKRPSSTSLLEGPAKKLSGTVGLDSSNVQTIRHPTEAPQCAEGVDEKLEGVVPEAKLDDKTQQMHRQLVIENRNEFEQHKRLRLQQQQLQQHQRMEALQKQEELRMRQEEERKRWEWHEKVQEHNAAGQEPPVAQWRGLGSPSGPSSTMRENDPNPQASKLLSCTKMIGREDVSDSSPPDGASPSRGEERPASSASPATRATCLTPDTATMDSTREEHTTEKVADVQQEALPLTRVTRTHPLLVAQPKSSMLFPARRRKAIGQSAVSRLVEAREAAQVDDDDEPQEGLSGRVRRAFKARGSVALEAGFALASPSLARQHAKEKVTISLARGIVAEGSMPIGSSAHYENEPESKHGAPGPPLGELPPHLVTQGRVPDEGCSAAKADLDRDSMQTPAPPQPGSAAAVLACSQPANNEVTISEVKGAVGAAGVSMDSSGREAHEPESNSGAPGPPLGELPPHLVTQGRVPDEGCSAAKADLDHDSTQTSTLPQASPTWTLPRPNTLGQYIRVPAWPSCAPSGLNVDAADEDWNAHWHEYWNEDGNEDGNEDWDEDWHGNWHEDWSEDWKEHENVDETGYGGNVADAEIYSDSFADTKRELDAKEVAAHRGLQEALGPPGLARVLAARSTFELAKRHLLEVLPNLPVQHRHAFLFGYCSPSDVALLNELRLHAPLSCPMGHSNIWDAKFCMECGTRLCQADQSGSSTQIWLGAEDDAIAIGALIIGVGEPLKAENDESLALAFALLREQAAAVSNVKLEQDALASQTCYSLQTVPVSDIQYTQRSCGAQFRNGWSLQRLMNDLASGDVNPMEHPNMVLEVVQRQCILFSNNNRRLYCLKQHQRQRGHLVQVQVKLYQWSQAFDRLLERLPERAGMRHDDIRVRRPRRA